MKYNASLGIWVFKGNEDDLMFIHFWQLAIDLSWYGKIETLWRIMVGQPPQRYFEITKRLREQECKVKE